MLMCLTVNLDSEFLQPNFTTVKHRQVHTMSQPGQKPEKAILNSMGRYGKVRLNSVVGQIVSEVK